MYIYFRKCHTKHADRKDDVIMKKFFKFLLGAAATLATIGAALYFLKNILMKDYVDDYDDDDFDNDLYEEDDEADDFDDFPETPNDERDYVTINMPEKSDDEDGEEDAAAEETAEENASETSEE